MFYKKKFISLIVALCLVFSLMSTPAFAGTYSHDSAVTYAEQYATSYNSSYRSFSSDCANYVSQCLKAGGWTYVDPYNNQTSNNVWWYHDIYLWPDETSHTWSVAYKLLSFTRYNSSPLRGQCASTWSYPGTTYTAYPSDMYPGDIFFYDWTTNSSVDHVTIYVINGTDPEGDQYTGALVDSHTSDRYHAIWSLSSYNPDKYTTTIYAMKIKNNF